MGPSTVPCGTPEVTGTDVEVSPSSTTAWVLLLRKSAIQAITLVNFSFFPKMKMKKMDRDGGRASPLDLPMFSNVCRPVNVFVDLSNE